MKKFVASLIVASSTVLVTPPTSHAKILIGMPGPMAGGMAWFGEQMEQGTAMKVAELNAAGGVLGQEVEVLIVDDYCDPEQATAAAQNSWRRTWTSSSATHAPARPSAWRRAGGA